jgi:RHS repeat-associated protein
MLQSWIGPVWGLLGGFLIAVQIGVYSYWSQSYWGGMVAALGGALFFIGCSPRGKKLAIMKAQVVQQAFVPLPGKTKAEYLSWGLSHYRHPDWLGSSRLESSTTHAIIQDTAYDPFGVPYAELSGGNGEISFTGQNKDTAWLQYDFLDRQYDPKQGRWLSPDPMGLAAADPASPQSWNRYVYVQNNPLALVDPFGDDGCYDQNGQSVGVVQGICESMGGWTWQQSISLPSPINGLTYTAQMASGGLAWVAPNGETLSSASMSELGLPALPAAPNGLINCSGAGIPCWFAVQGNPFSSASLNTISATSAVPQKSVQTAQIVTASCMAGRLIDNFIGPSGSGALTIGINMLMLLKPVGTSFLPGPGWLYTATALGYDAIKVMQSYNECKYGGGQPVETPAGEQPEEAEQ